MHFHFHSSKLNFFASNLNQFNFKSNLTKNTLSYKKKITSAFGGITPPAPLYPYAYSEGQIKYNFSPKLIHATTSS